MSKPVLAALFSSTCPHCHKFKEAELGPLRDNLGSADLVEVNIENGNWPTGVPKDLAKHSYGFPAFMLVDRRSWDDSQRGRNVVLNPSVFNGGKDSKGNPTYVPTYSMNHSSIIKWANSTRPTPYKGNDKKITLTHKGKAMDSFTKSSVSWE